MTTALADTAIEILRATRDGDDLDPKHLKLVELAVNGHLNDAGLAAFQNLLEQVRAGYAKPWLHGVEHITRDHDGYVLWKCQSIEHFSQPYASGGDAKVYVQELARRCAILEDRNEVPTTTNVVWRWPD